MIIIIDEDVGGFFAISEVIKEVLEYFDAGGAEYRFVLTDADDNVDAFVLGVGAGENVFFEGSYDLVEVAIPKLNVEHGVIENINEVDDADFGAFDVRQDGG